MIAERVAIVGYVHFGL